MANVGDKYIIEIGRANVDSDGTPYYSVKGAEWYGLSEMLLSKLERFDPDEKANADYNAGYREGMHEAWQAAKKIALIEELGGMWFDEIMDVFGMGGDRVFTEMEPAEVIAKLNQYERKKEKEIHIGDEVSGVGGTWIVTLMKDGQCYGIDSNGDTHGDLMKDLTKTGRSFPELVEAIHRIKEEQDDEA